MWGQKKTMGKDVGDELKVIARGASLIFIGTFISKVLMYFYRLVVARWLGPSDYGLISIGISVFWLSLGFIKLGFTSGIKRRVSHFIGKGEESKVTTVLWSVLLINIPWSVLVAFILFLTADIIAVGFFNQPELGFIIRMFSIAVPFQMLYHNLAAFLKGLRDVKYHVVSDKIFRSLFTLTSAIVLIYFGWEVRGALYAEIGGIILSTVLLLLLVEFKAYPFIRDRRFDGLLKEQKTVLKFALPLFVSTIIGKLMGHADTIMIGFFEASESAGVYNAAFPTAGIITVAGGAVGTMLFPTISKLYSSGKKDLSEEVASVALKWIFLVSFPAMVFMVLFGNSILNFLFGEAYVGGAYALAVLGIGYTVKNLSRHYGSFIKSEDETSLILKITAGIFVFNILLNIVLIPRIGISGAAVATAFASAAKSLVGSLVVYFKFGVNPYRKNFFVPGLVSTLVAGGSVYVVLKYFFDIVPLWAMIPGGIGFMLIYGVLFLRLGGINKHDMEILRSVDEKTGENLETVKKIVRMLIK